MSLQNPEYVRKFQEFCGIVCKKNSCGSLIKNTNYRQNHVETNDNQNKNCHINTGHNNNSNNNVTHTDANRFGDDGHSTIKNDNSPVQYEIKIKLLYYLALFGAFLGDEVFYFTFYPFIAWNMDQVVARRTEMVWCVVMYLGQRTKDYLQWPRPPVPPVILLETSHLYETAMPSTHAMAGTAMPLVLAFTICSRYEV